MIKKLSIKNFKSIKELEIDCKRINLFIGEPNTGKSNILEALGLLSWCAYRNVDLTEYVRFQNMQELFYDGNFIDESLQICVEIEDGIGIDLHVKFEFQNDKFFISLEIHLKDNTQQAKELLQVDYSGRVTGQVSGTRNTIVSPNLRIAKPYKFKQQKDFKGTHSSFLIPPHGSNMFALVMGSKRLREVMSQFFEDFGFKLILKPQEKTFEMLKQGQDVVFTYPYILTPDTLQRIIFYTVAIESNENSTLIFEEPEAHAFPYYTKYLGEKIAFDEKNQYFIATHNPYLLLSILEKTPENDVNVFVTYLRDYQTRVKCLNDEEISELMQYEPFFNLDSFIEEEEEEEQ